VGFLESGIDRFGGKGGSGSSLSRAQYEKAPLPAVQETKNKAGEGL